MVIKETIKLDPSTCYKVGTDVVSVEFAAIDGVTRFAVDQYKDVYQQVTEYYQQYKAGDKEIAASAKFMLPGTSDKFAVKIKDVKPEFDPAKVHFVTMSGKEYEKTYIADSLRWEITVVSSDVNDGQELFAVYEETPGKYATIALINIYTYEPLERSVTLVPVNGQMNGLSKESVASGLNRIYDKIGIHWNVNELNAVFNYAPKNGSTFNVTGSGLFSTQTDDMKGINEAFKQSGEYQEDGLYLFILPFDASDKGEIAGTNGDMPLGSQFGYLFQGVKADDRTIAHEVGHGAFSLEHPFDRPLRNSFQKYALVDNLMDYTDGIGFAKIQWDQTRAPGLVIGLFQRDKSGMSDRVKDIDSFLLWIKSNIGQKEVKYNKAQFYDTHSPWIDLPNESKEIKAIFYVELSDNGMLDLDKKEDGFLPSIGLEFDLNNKYHNGFYFKIKYSDKDETAIRIWSYSYEDFEKLLKYLGLQIIDKSKGYIVELYEESIKKAGKDCDKLDVIYETIPDFVIATIPSDTLYSHLGILGECSFGNHNFNKLWWADTDEKKAVLNILKGFDPGWFYKKVNGSPVLLEKILYKVGITSTYSEEIIKTILEKSAPNWEGNDLSYNDCFFMGSKSIELTEAIINGSFTAYNTNPPTTFYIDNLMNSNILSDYSTGYIGLSGSDGDSELLRRLGLDSKLIMLLPAVNNHSQYITVGGCGDLTEGVFNFGNEITQGLPSPLNCTLHIKKQALEPIIVLFENGNEQILPAIIAKWYLKEYGSSYKMQILNLGLMVVLPEALIKPATWAKWSNFLKGKNAINVVKIDEQLLSELNLLTNSDKAVQSFVTANIDRLIQSPNTIWDITYDAVRGRVWEHVRALTDLKDWKFIGGQNQKLLDFFYDNSGIIMQQKSIRADVTASTLNSYKSQFKTIIDNIENVVKNKNYKLQDGTVISVTKGQFDIVVQQGLDYDILLPLKQTSPYVEVRFIVK